MLLGPLVAEGVEDDETAAALTGMGVALLQGYLISPPLALIFRDLAGRGGPAVLAAFEG